MAVVVPVKKFRLLPGKRHSHALPGLDDQGKPALVHRPLEPGEVVELTQNQAWSFKDKFVQVDSSEFGAPSANVIDVKTPAPTPKASEAPKAPDAPKA